MKQPPRRRLTRRQVLAGLFSMAIVPYPYARWWERHRPQIVEREAYVPDLPPELDGLRVVQLSDLHIGKLNSAELMEKAVALAQSLAPDLVLLTGDFVTYSGKDAFGLSPILKQLSPKLGVYACLGNHDHWEGASTVLAALKAGSVKTLVNQAELLQHKGQTLLLGGLDSAWGGRPDMSAIAKHWTRRRPTLLMAHEPDIADQVQASQIPLMQLSGHTHGGQVRAPFYGHLASVTWGKKYIIGDYTVGNVQLYVNRGIGVVTHPVRMLCAPEVTCHTLRRLE
jgi:uncharacterized protein